MRLCKSNKYFKLSFYLMRKRSILPTISVGKQLDDWPCLQLIICDYL